MLCDNGCNVLGIDNMNDYYDVSLKESRLKILKKNKLFTFYNFDIKDMTLCNKFFLENEIDFIFHLAAQAGVRYSLKNPQVYIDSNITGFVNILESCKNFNINSKNVNQPNASLNCYLHLPFCPDRARGI